MSDFIYQFEAFPHQKLFNSNNLLNITEYNNTIVLDLFDTFISIVYHDFFTNRVEGRKVLDLKVPVQNLAKFNKVKKDINNLVTFMTGGEEWNISFIQADYHKSIHLKTQNQMDTFQFDSIALISAGLDSMAGVCEEISSSNRTLYINSYAKNESRRLIEIYKDVSGMENSKIITINKYPRLYDGNVTLHSNQRTRSLAFIANALLYSDYYNVKIIKMYENGIMSLNPTFNSRRGVTKTTHHKTIYMINKILRTLEIKSTVVNPFKFKTKKDVISLINSEMQIKIKDTRTCSKGNVVQLNRGGRNGAYHCGVCIACMLRIMSTHDTDINDASYLTNIYEKSRDTSNKEDKSYSYHEKKSLIEYYKRFKKEIDGGTIYDYLEGIHQKYFDGDSSFLEKLDDMLRKFSNEINNYVGDIKYD